MYLEHASQNSFDIDLNCSTNLIEKLMKNDNLNTLVLNLYPGNEGYSLTIFGYPNIETDRIAYEVCFLISPDFSDFMKFLLSIRKMSSLIM